jgi:hypothetical protein
MINAYAASKSGGKLEKFEYDPGELASHVSRLTWKVVAYVIAI